MLVSTATFKELTEALLSGGFIRNPTSGLILHVSPEGDLIDQDNDIRPVLIYRHWVVYTPQWYDDIPTEGILCWVFDQDSKTQSRVEMLK